MEDAIKSNMAANVKKVSQYLDLLFGACDQLRDVIDNRTEPKELPEHSMLGSVTLLRVLGIVHHDLALRGPKGEKPWSRAEIQD